MPSVIKPLTSIKRRAPEEVLATLNSENPRESADAGMKLLAEARSYGLEMRDYLRLAIDPTKSNDRDRFDGLNGYEAALKYLNLPIADDFDGGVPLDLASDTFEFSPGTRALFPEVIDDMVRYKYRSTNFENLASLIASTRTINGVEMISTVVNDDDPEDFRVMGPVSEFGRFRIGSIRTSESRVKMYKLGGGYRTSYEFSRRARLDLLTPYAARMQRELESSKVGLAVALLINGDSVQPAAPVVNQSAYNGKHGSENIAAGQNRIGYKHLLQWLVERAKAGAPVDTVVGGWDAYLDWLFLFALPVANATTRTDAENLAASGFRIGGVPILNGQVNFTLASDMPQGQLMGMTKGETLEELIEAGSLISESERAIQTQSITYVKSEVSGFRLVYPDTRSIFDYSK